MSVHSLDCYLLFKWTSQVFKFYFWHTWIFNLQQNCLKINSCSWWKWLKYYPFKHKLRDFIYFTYFSFTSFSNHIISLFSWILSGKGMGKTFWGLPFPFTFNDLIIWGNFVTPWDEVCLFISRFTWHTCSTAIHGNHPMFVYLLPPHILLPVRTHHRRTCTESCDIS